MANTLDSIEFVRIHSGFWQIQVNGSLRPIVIGRQGRNWIVQGPAPRNSKRNEVHHGAARTLNDAKSLAVFAWLALDTERELARHDALEQEYRQLRVLARELRVTYPIAVDASTDLPRKIATVRARIASAGQTNPGRLLPGRSI